MIVVGAPMYNFGIPSQLKAWIDALAVPGKTFRYTSGGAEGLLGEKRLIIASSQGGFYKPGTPMASFDHQEAHLRSFFNFLGVTDIRVVRADGVKAGPDGQDRVLERDPRGLDAGSRLTSGFARCDFESRPDPEQPPDPSGRWAGDDTLGVNRRSETAQARPWPGWTQGAR